MRQLILLLSLTPFCWIHLLNAAPDVHELKSIDALSEGRVIQVHIMADNNKLERAALLAFRAHGAYDIVDEARAEMVFQLKSLGDNEVNLKIQSNPSKQVLFEKNVRGKGAYHTALKACDLAVVKTLGLPGFFASKITFVGERTGHREIWVSDLFFSKPVQLTKDKTNSLNPQLSPSGDFIIYTSYRNTFPDLYIMDLKRNKRDVFADYEGTNNGGVFSPDGRWVASTFSSTGNPELWIMTAKKSSPRRLTKNGGIEASPSWSKDGERIVFSSDSGIGSPQLFQISTNGGAMQRIHTKISGYCAEPDWNPRDANLIAFTVAVGGSFQLAIYDFETDKSDFLTNSGGDNVEPCWTHDGRHLIYTKRVNQSKSLWIIDTETKKTVELHSSAFGHASQADSAYPLD